MNVKDMPLHTQFGVDFGRALTENAAAQRVYETMTPEDREKLRRRVAEASSPDQLREIVDSMVGSQPGHPPYQL